MRNKTSSKVLFLLLVSIAFSISSFADNGKSLRVMFTGDLHGTVENFAKLSDAIKKERAKSDTFILVDAGDWAEASPQYLVAGNDFMLEYFEKNGYDAAIVGNHDYYSGAKYFVDSVSRHKNLKVLAANLEFGRSNFNRPENLLASHIVERNGLKIGIVGVTASDILYDYFLKPIKITPPVDVVKRTVQLIRPNVDVVIVVSHNKQEINKAIASIPGIDLIIGGHDHQILQKEIKFNHPDGITKVITDIGPHGKRFGIVEFKQQLSGKFKYDNYKVIETYKYERDTEIQKWVDDLNKKTNEKFGPDFDKEIARSVYDASRFGFNNDMGNMLTDVYRDAANADFAFEDTGWINNYVKFGIITPRKVFDMFPHTYNFDTGKTWEVQVLKIKGKDLISFLTMVLTINTSDSRSGVSFSSNVEIKFKQNMGAIYDSEKIAIQVFKINGKDVDSNKIYSVAVSPMAIVGEFIIKTIAGYDPKIISRENTGKEIYTEMKKYFTAVKVLKPITKKDRITIVK